MHIEQDPKLVNMLTRIRVDNPGFMEQITDVEGIFTYQEAIDMFEPLNDELSKTYLKYIQQLTDVNPSDYICLPIPADNPEVFNAKETPWIDAHKLSNEELSNYIIWAILVGIQVDLKSIGEYMIVLDGTKSLFNFEFTYNIIPIDNFDMTSYYEDTSSDKYVAFIFSNNVGASLKEFVIQHNSPVISEVMS